MAALTQVITSDLLHLSAVFNAAMDTATLQGGSKWLLTPPVGAIPAVITVAVAETASKVNLVVGPALTAGATYTLQAPSAKDSNGNVLPPQDNTIQFVAPNVPGIVVDSGGLLAVFTRMFGEAVQELAGRALTRLVAGFGEDDAIAYVETTLGFPNKGAFFVNGRRYTYTGKTDASFTGCVKQRPYDGTASAYKTVLYNDVYGTVLEE